MTENDWMAALAGRCLVFDGPDGSGKSTQFARFAAACRDAGLHVCEVREPGGTPIGERVRDILLDHAHADMTVRCEMLLYMASRAQLTEARIRPALAAGSLVLADRFVSSTLAYQGAGGGLPTDDIKRVAEVATADLRPDLVVIFDVDEATAARRLSPLLDRMEAKGRAFHAKVRQGYLDQAKADPDRHLVLDAAACEDDVYDALIAGVRAHVERAPG